MSYCEPVSLTTKQSAADAAAFIQLCWRQRFLASVQDQLLSHEPDRVTDDDVLAAIGAVRGAFHSLDFDDD